MGRLWGFFPVLGAFFFFALSASAYTPTVTPGGVPVRWSSNVLTGGIRIEVAGNPGNQCGLSAREVFEATTHSLQRWKAAAGGTVDFDYWQGSDASVYTPSSAYDGLSALYFASNARQDPHLSSNVLGLTQVWYDTSTGRILETDIVLNDRDFRFTTDPRDTSGYGSAFSVLGAGKASVFIENVLTHELGHAFGLSHSGGLQSSMLFMESPEQAHLGCDEQIAIHALYPARQPAPRGAIEGVVVNDGGVPVFGAHVVAVSRRRGTVLATALTDKSGRYALSALESGSYFLMVEPFYAGAQTLPNYYSQVRADFCGGRSFGRTLLTDSTGHKLSAVSVDSGKRTEAPLMVAHCDSAGGANVSVNDSSSALSSAPVVFDGTREAGGFGSLDRFSYVPSNYYKIKAIAGHLEVHALTYSVYSPVRSSLSLLDSSGRSVAVTELDQVYEGDSGYVNYDSAIVADGLAAGDYYVKVSASYLDSSLYPAGPISLDSIPFVILTGSVNESAPPLANSLPLNARCRMEEEFAAYSSPAGNPTRRSDGNSGIGFCGTVKRLGQGPGSRPSDGPGPGAAAILGWLLPFLLIPASAQLLRRGSDIS